MSVISKELKFYKTLPLKARVLVFSFVLRSVASPIFSLFINSFIWRTTSSFFNVAIYNLGFFIFLPLGFYINGLLLKKIKINILYLVGLFVSTLTALVIIFFSGTCAGHFLVYGLFLGFANGMYWANRNFLSWQETKSEQRNYFFSIVSIFDSLVILAVTFLAGWAIELSDYTNLYTPTMAYIALSILAGVFLITSGLIILKTSYQTPRVGRMIQFNISKIWNKIRFLNFSMGIKEGLNFYLPALLVLFYLGEEGTLGTISSMVILLTVVITYFYGRKSRIDHCRPTFFISASLYIVAAGLLFVLPQPYNIFVFVLLAGISNKFQWLSVDPAWLDVVDKEVSHKANSKYTLIFDLEVFLDLGRSVSVLGLFLLIKFTTEKMGFFLAPLVLGTIQLVLISLVWKKKSFN